MLFNSYVFIFVMLPLSIIGYYWLNKKSKYRLALAYLLGMSLWFIGYMNIRYILILVPCVVINYLVAHAMNNRYKSRQVARKRLLTMGIVIDVGILLVFKYYDFFVSTLNDVIKLDIPTVKLLLPLGISFYTFQQISYLVDCYRDDSIDYDILVYATYVCFYPQFVQGPIVLQSELIPQLLDEKRKEINYECFAKGMYRFTLGLAKKVLIADTLALMVDAGYEKIDALNTLSVLVIILAYTLQIYFDFSGYSDMAIGVGNMFNIDLPENFDSPYKARSIEEFWDRWHITLTRFFTKYIYIPLGGNRKGNVRTYVNVLFIFLISGFWHGAEWSFVLWGLMHGILMLVKRLINSLRINIPSLLETLLTFIFVNLAWVFFRADNIEVAFCVLRQLFSGGFNGLSNIIYEPFDETVEGALLCRMDILGINDMFHGMIAMLFVTLMILICFISKNTRDRMLVWKPSKKTMLVFSLLGIWCVLSFSGVTNYVYWNF